MVLLEFPIPFGPYVLLERVSVGGMAEVFKAREVGRDGFSRTVAIKTMLAHVRSDPMWVELFVREARVVSGLKHANIVEVFGSGRVGSDPYIAMEYVSGRDLRMVFNRCERAAVRVPVALACYVVSKVCAALDYVHRRGGAGDRGLVHRDVSPANVVVSFDGEVKLADFGVAGRCDEALGESHAVYKGKLGYASAEQLAGARVDSRSDVFSLGVLLFELLTGRRLFGAEHAGASPSEIRESPIPRPSQCRDDLPPGIDPIVLAALAADRSARYPTAAEFKDALDHFLLAQGMFSTRKDLALWMQDLFRADLALDRQRDREPKFAAGPVPVSATASPPPDGLEGLAGGGPRSGLEERAGDVETGEAQRSMPVVAWDGGETEVPEAAAEMRKTQRSMPVGPWGASAAEVAAADRTQPSMPVGSWAEGVAETGKTQLSMPVGSWAEGVAETGKTQRSMPVGPWGEGVAETGKTQPSMPVGPWGEGVAETGKTQPSMPVGPRGAGPWVASGKTQPATPLDASRRQPPVEPGPPARTTQRSIPVAAAPAQGSGVAPIRRKTLVMTSGNRERPSEVVRRRTSRAEPAAASAAKDPATFATTPDDIEWDEDELATQAFSVPSRPGGANVAGPAPAAAGPDWVASAPSQPPVPAPPSWGTSESGPERVDALGLGLDARRGSAGGQGMSSGSIEARTRPDPADMASPSREPMRVRGTAVQPRRVDPAVVGGRTEPSEAAVGSGAPVARRAAVWIAGLVALGTVGVSASVLWLQRAASETVAAAEPVEAVEASVAPASQRSAPSRTIVVDPPEPAVAVDLVEAKPDRGHLEVIAPKTPKPEKKPSQAKATSRSSKAKREPAKAAPDVPAEVASATLRIGTVSGVPPAEVHVDGRYVGKTPRPSIAVTPGRHTVTYRWPNGREVRKTVTVAEGSVKIVKAG